MVVLLADDNVNRLVEDLFDASHLFTATLHVSGTHTGRDLLALLRRDRSQTLRAQELNAIALVSKVRLETKEDDGSSWAEVKNLRVPLQSSQYLYVIRRLDQ